MKRLMLLFISAYFVTGCRSEEEKLKEQMMPVVTKIILRDSLVVKVDSLIIFDIDTITDKIYNTRRINKIVNYMDLLKSMSDSHLSTAQLHASSAKSMQNQAQLYQYIGSPTLARIQLDDAKREIEKMNKDLSDAKLYADSLTFYNKIVQKLSNDIKSGKTDSSNFRGFMPWVRVVGSDKQGAEVKLDSIYIYLSKTMAVIPVKIDD